jgi:excisionase family DNA binding protein
VISGHAALKGSRVRLDVNDPHQLLTVPEVAKLLHVSAVYVRREIRDGALRTVRLGRSVRIARDDLQSYIEAKREGP